MDIKRDSIKKALECCSSEGHICGKCSYSNVRIGISCRDKLSRDALSLINELTQENERLRGEKDVRDILVKDLTRRNKELQSANEDLGKHCIELQNELYQCVEIKAKALDDFKVRLTIATGTYTNKDYINVNAWFKLVDKIITEMKEGV